ncbi:hypothetical protein RB598_003006 [Gaeumannomyces tritici]
MQWTEEETRYLRAILTWQAKPDHNRASLRNSTLALTEKQDEMKKPVGNLRILVVGAEGCGKTSILTRVRPPACAQASSHLQCLSYHGPGAIPGISSPAEPAPRSVSPLTQPFRARRPLQFCTDAFRGDAGPADSSFEGGCRRLVEVGGQNYAADVLELPGRHLSADVMLQNALNITEGAVLVYDVTDRTSLALAARIQHYIKDAVGPREYGLLLVGNKSDTSGETGRVIPATDGKVVAVSFDMECGFMEASARTGENVAAIFPAIGHEILRLRLLSREQREEAEMAAMLNMKAQTGAAMRSRRGIWKTITSPFARRRSTMPL